MTDRRREILFYIGLGAALAAGAVVYFAVISPNRGRAAMSLKNAEDHLAASNALCPRETDGAAEAAKLILVDDFEKAVAPILSGSVAAMRADVETFVFRLPKEFKAGGKPRDRFGKLLEQASRGVKDRRLSVNPDLGFTDADKVPDPNAAEDEDDRTCEGLLERLAVAERVLAAVRASGVKDVTVTQLARQPLRGAPDLKWSIEPVAMDVKLFGDEKSLAQFLYELQNVDRVMPKQERRDAEEGNGYVCLKDLTVKYAQKSGLEARATVYGAFHRDTVPAAGPKPGVMDRRPPPRRAPP